MKKIITVLLITALALSTLMLASCGGKSDDTTTAAPSGTASGEEGKTSEPDGTDAPGTQATVEPVEVPDVTLKYVAADIYVNEEAVESSGYKKADALNLSNWFAEKKEFKNMVKGEMGKDTMQNVSRMLAGKLAEATRKRAPQAEAVADYLKRHRGESIILCGDFNDNPISYARRTIARRLTDCFVESGFGPGISYHENRMYFRIDNIMCSKDWKPYNCKVDRKIALSDHYPMYCWLKKR